MEVIEDFKTEEGQAEAPGENLLEEQCPEGSEIADWTEEGQVLMPGENQVVVEQCTKGSVMADPTEEVGE